MSVETPHTDFELLELLRIAGPMRVTAMADAMEVTPTAVRQRLVRLMASGLIQRTTVRNGRGRPRHDYWLTERGVRQTGSNFTDLAIALWTEVKASGDAEFAREILRRLVRAMVAGYAKQIQGETPLERLRSLQELLAQRAIPATVNSNSQHAVLTEHACPYPNLAEQDRDICALERALFSELVGAELSLVQCRLDGEKTCQFQVSQSG
jgi:predicted ArsR family transcriptional regulator